MSDPNAKGTTEAKKAERQAAVGRKKRALHGLTQAVQLLLVLLVVVLVLLVEP